MRVLYFSFFVIFTDQVTKLLVKGFSIPFLNIHFDGMYLGQSFDIFGNFLKITFVENPGMAFGVEVGSLKVLLSLFSLVAAVAIFIYLYKIKEQNFYYRLALSLILGGALGNFIDRAFYGVFYDYAPLMLGKVVDFIDVNFFTFSIFGHTFNRWPVFNIADSAVTVGVIILLIFHNKFERELEKSKNANSTEFPDEVNDENYRPEEI